MIVGRFLTFSESVGEEDPSFTVAREVQVDLDVLGVGKPMCEFFTRPESGLPLMAIHFLLLRRDLAVGNPGF